MNIKIKQIFKIPINEYILLTLVLAVGFAVRIYKIDSPVADWHSWRQADTASVTRIYTLEGINLSTPRYYDISSVQSRIFNPKGYRMVEFPVYNALGAVLASNYSLLTLEVWSRLITIFCALITSVFLFLIGKKYLGTAGGILAASFYLFVPFNIYFTRVILPDPMGVTFATASVWFFIKFTESENTFHLFLSAVLFSLALLIKPYLGFYLIPITYLAVEKYGLKNLLKAKKLIIKELLYGAIILVPFALWRWWEGKHPEGIPLFWWAFNGDAIRFRPAFWRWIFGERLGHLILGIWGLPLFIFGLISAGKEKFINYFAGGALVYVILVASANVKHDYYQILTIPAVSLVLAQGVIYLWNNNAYNKIFSRMLILFCVPLMFMMGWERVKGNYAVNHPEILEAGAAIDKIAPKDALVIAPYSGDTAFLYATKRYGWPVMDNSIDNIIAEGADYYVSVDLASTDTLSFAKRFVTVEKTARYIILDLHQGKTP